MRPTNKLTVLGRIKMRKIFIIIILVVSMSVLLLSQSGSTRNAIRNYMLVFEVTEYSDQLREAVVYFFKRTFLPGDQLIVITPARFYGFSPKTLSIPKDQLISKILGTLKNDINLWASKYRIILEEMKKSVQIIAGGRGSVEALISGDQLQAYRQNRANLSTLRGSYEEKLKKYADVFRRVRGDNHLLMFFRQEFRPIPDIKAMETLRGQLGTREKVNEVFLGERFKENIDFEKIQNLFRYAGIKFHFLYLKGKKIRYASGVEYIENTGHLYNLFSKLSKATSGIKLVSSKPSSFVKRVRQSVEGKVTVEVTEEEMEK
jgi:hypothetical protein